MNTKIKYQIVERNDAEGFALVRFLNPKWDKSLVVIEKQDVVEQDEAGEELTSTIKTKVDKNHHQHHEHRVMLPAQVEGEDYESVTLPNRIEEVGRGVMNKMAIRAIQNQGIV